METFLILVCLIVAVLNIILFFKVWRMTNDVNKIRKRFINKYEDLSFTEVNSELGKYIIKGDKEGAKSFLTECLLSQLTSIPVDSSEYNYMYAHLVYEYSKLYLRIGEKQLPYNLEGLGSEEFRQILESGLK
jgi:hypothetical protein